MSSGGSSPTALCGNRDVTSLYAMGSPGHAHDRITVTRNGRPAAVLISPDELASLEDTLDLLSDPDAMAQLRAAQAALEAGDYVTGDELRAKYPTR